MSIKFGTAALLASIAMSGQEVSAIGFHWGIGWCDPFGPSVVKDLDIERYMGNWYNVVGDKDFNGDDYRCATATYTLKKDEWWNPYPVEVLNRKDSGGTVSDGKCNGIFGRQACARARCTWGNGACNVKFGLAPDANYLILDVDYDSHALIYNCDTWLGLFYTNAMWINSRAGTISDANKSNLKNILKDRVPSFIYPADEQMVDVDQVTNCNYGF